MAMTGPPDRHRRSRPSSPVRSEEPVGPELFGLAPAAVAAQLRLADEAAGAVSSRIRCRAWRPGSSPRPGRWSRLAQQAPPGRSRGAAASPGRGWAARAMLALVDDPARKPATPGVAEAARRCWRGPTRNWTVSPAARGSGPMLARRLGQEIAAGAGLGGVGRRARLRGVGLSRWARPLAKAMANAAPRPLRGRTRAVPCSGCRVCCAALVALATPTGACPGGPSRRPALLAA